MEDERLYDLIISKKELNNDSLKKIGYDKEKINELLKNNILKEDNGIYFISDYKTLEKYSKYLYINKNVEKNIICSEYLLSINDNNYYILNNLIVSYIYKGMYYKAYPLIKKLYLYNYKTLDEYRSYLYLLDKLYTIDTEDKKLISNIKNENYTFHYTKESYKVVIEVVVLAIRNKFEDALNIIKSSYESTL